MKPAYEKHIYFNSLDVLVLIEYDKRENMNILSCTTSRELSPTERVSIEAVIFRMFAAKETTYYSDSPASFAYLGYDPKLVVSLHNWKRENAAAGVENIPADTDAELLKDYWMSQSLTNWKAEVSNRRN